MNILNKAPYPGKRIKTLDEVDRALHHAGEARKSSENAFLEKLQLFWFDYPPISGDPWSHEYRQHWLTVYEKLAGKSYEIENEYFDFDVNYHIKHPYPYCTQDYHIVANHLQGIANIIKALALPAGASVLEMGAGWGNTSIFLAQMGYNVTVLDINHKYGDLIEQRAQSLDINIDFVCAGYEDISKLGKSFDCVLFFESFHHAYDHLKLLDLIPEALSTNGRLALAGEPMNENLPFDWGLNPAGEALWQIRTHGWFELVFRESYLISTLEKKGFIVEKHECKNNPIGTTLICSRV